MRGEAAAAQLAIGDAGAERQFPGPAPGQKERPRRIDRSGEEIDRQRGEQDQRQRGREKPLKPEQQHQQRRRDEIELFLYAQRPQMQQRLGLRRRFEVIVLARQPKIEGEERAFELLLGERGQGSRIEQQEASGPDADYDDRQSRKYALDPLGVEVREAERLPATPSE